jgi:exopolysaccharide production protein ExoZ
LSTEIAVGPARGHVPERVLDKNTRSEEIYSIQYIRGISALLVIFSHSSEQFLSSSGSALGILHDIGWGGVDLFFVISGFIMVYTTESYPLNPAYPGWDFFRRRVARVVPLYWLMTLFTASIAILLPNLLKTTTFSWSKLVASLLFIPFRDPLTGSMTPLLHLGWTLNFEMLFYVCFALGLAINRPWRRLAVIGAVFMSLIALSHWLPVEPPYLFPIHFWGTWVTMEFLAGCVLGMIYLRVDFDRFPQLLGSALFGIGLAAMVIFAIKHGESDVNARAIWKGIPAVVIVLSALMIERKHAFTNDRLRQLGDATYSLYLCHLLVVMGLRKLWLQAQLPTTGGFSLLYVAVCLLVAVPFGVFVHEFRYGEKWMISHAKRVVKGWPPPKMWFGMAKSGTPSG